MLLEDEPYRPFHGQGCPREGLVKGEVLTWRATGPLMKLPQGGPSIKSYSGETTVNSDEMSGRADGYYCPCTFVLHRVNTNSIRGKQAK